MTVRYPDRAQRKGKARRLQRQQEAQERNTHAAAEMRLCGHVHGLGVTCAGRVVAS